MSVMGMTTGYEGLFLAWAPASDVPAARFEDASVDELVQEWEVELEAVRRREKLRLVREESRHDRWTEGRMNGGRPSVPC